MTKEVRIWTEGCFDMNHFGHSNVFRQAKQFGDKLVVGVHCDRAISMIKGATIMSQEERMRLVGAVRWVDEVVDPKKDPNCLKQLENFNCELLVHGDDAAIFSGHDYFAPVKAANKYREVPRMPGISTTDIVKRLLLKTTDRENHFSLETPNFCTASLIESFCQGQRRPADRKDKVVYVDGAFDLFHVGHLAFLEAAAAQGTYLIVGVHTDKTVSSRKGPARPFLSWYERLLGILAYRCVDDVILDPPTVLDGKFLGSFDISVVCHGATSKSQKAIGTVDPYSEPKRRGMFKIIDNVSPVTTESIIDRVVKCREKYENRRGVKEEVN